MKFVFAAIILIATMSSCKSEYERQMEHAVAHKKMIENQSEMIDASRIKTIQEQISFCAEMSGSKVMFLKELEEKF